VLYSQFLKSGGSSAADLRAYIEERQRSHSNIAEHHLLEVKDADDEDTYTARIARAARINQERLDALMPRWNELKAKYDAYIEDPDGGHMTQQEYDELMALNKDKNNTERNLGAQNQVLNTPPAATPSTTCPTGCTCNAIPGTCDTTEPAACPTGCTCNITPGTCDAELLCAALNGTWGGGRCTPAATTEPAACPAGCTCNAIPGTCDTTDTDDDACAGHDDCDNGGQGGVCAGSTWLCY